MYTLSCEYSVVNPVHCCHPRSILLLFCCLLLSRLLLFVERFIIVLLTDPFCSKRLNMWHRVQPSETSFPSASSSSFSSVEVTLPFDPPTRSVPLPGQSAMCVCLFVCMNT